MEVTVPLYNKLHGFFAGSGTAVMNELQSRNAAFGMPSARTGKGWRNILRPSGRQGGATGPGRRRRPRPAAGKDASAPFRSGAARMIETAAPDDIRRLPCRYFAGPKDYRILKIDIVVDPYDMRPLFIP